jgi:predicted transcriptional regulator
MSKTVSLPPVRIEPEYKDALEHIAGRMRPQASVSSLVRLAVVEYIARKQLAGAAADRWMTVANGETLNQV